MTHSWRRQNTKDGTLLSRFRHVFPTITNLRMYNMELDDGVFHVHGVVSAVSRGGLPTRQLQFVCMQRALTFSCRCRA